MITIRTECSMGRASAGSSAWFLIGAKSTYPCSLGRQYQHKEHGIRVHTQMLPTNHAKTKNSQLSTAALATMFST